MSDVVDQALDLADQCGWRDALIYLIHHGVSQEVVQRLLAGACVRRRSKPRPAACHPLATRCGPHDEDIAKLFDFLLRRRLAAASACHDGAAKPYRLDPEQVYIFSSRRGHIVTTQTGTVKWFNDAKGFGYITPAEGSPELFVQFQDIQGKGFRTRSEKQHVSCERTPSPKGEKATNVRPG